MAGKADIVDQMAQETGLTKSQAADAFDALWDAIVDHLEDDERVQIPGFGSFTCKKRAARKGRNPATGETIQIPATNYCKFKQSGELKETLNE